jgi:predicted RecB family nuclease
MKDWGSLAQASSAYQLAKIQECNRRLEKDIYEKNLRRKKVEDATIELNEETKKQNEILKTQLAEMKTANDLLVKQAADSAKLARISLLVAIVSAIGTILSLVL